MNSNEVVSTVTAFFIAFSVSMGTVFAAVGDKAWNWRAFAAAAIGAVGIAAKDLRSLRKMPPVPELQNGKPKGQ